MDTQAQLLWSKLAGAGLVTGPMPPGEDAAIPWYLRALVGVSAWIAAIFVLSSVAAVAYRIFDNAVLSVITGAALCVAAAVAMRRAPDGPFVSQFAMAIAIAGQVLLATGLLHAARPHDVLGWLSIAGMEVVMALAIADATHRTLAALFAMAALYASGWQSYAGSLLPVIAAVLFTAAALGADSSARAHALMRPGSAGVAVSLLLYVPVATLLADVPLRGAAHPLPAPWLQPALLAVVFVAAGALMLRRAHVENGYTRGVAMASAFVLAAAAWPVPGLLAALLVTIVSFAMGRRALVGLGLLAAVAMLGYYYFSLQTTLLVKSMSLIVTGAILLTCGLALAHRGALTGGARDA